MNVNHGQIMRCYLLAILRSGSQYQLPQWDRSSSGLIAALVVLGKPALQVPGDDLIERRSLRPSTGIPLLWSLSPRGG